MADVVRARPEALRAYADVAGDVSGDLGARSGEVGAALDGFRATDGWQEFLPDIPPLDIDLDAARGRVDRLGSWVAQVASAFEAVDRSGVVAMDQARLLATVPRLAAGAPRLVQVDGRWILSGSDQSDHIVLAERDGALVARVGRLDSSGTLRYEEVPLSDEQARNLVIRTGDGNDVIEVPPSASLGITAWTGRGDDLVGAAGDNFGVRLGGGGADALFLGEGDDVAFGGAGDDRLWGGAGRDVLDGQDGNDQLGGGDGYDVLYGGRGDDRLGGGRGNDALEGGSGRDEVAGDAGDDILSGGRDEDRLVGGLGHDRLLGGRGADDADGGFGSDTAVAEEGERASAERRITIALDGDPGDTAIEVRQPEWMGDEEFAAWSERIDSDLELIRTTPQGRAGLEALDERAEGTDTNWLPFVGRSRRVVVVPYGDTEAPDAALTVERWLDELSPDGGAASLGGNYASPPGGALDDDALVNYGGSHSAALDDRPPVASLYHELAHSYDQLGGGTEGGKYTEVLRAADGSEISRNTDVPRAEINSVGVDLDSDGGFDTRPNADGEEHPAALTENSLRDDLGWERRPSYTLVPDPGEQVDVEDLE